MKLANFAAVLALTGCAQGIATSDNTAFVPQMYTGLLKSSSQVEYSANFPRDKWGGFRVEVEGGGMAARDCDGYDVMLFAKDGSWFMTMQPQLQTVRHEGVDLTLCVGTVGASVIKSKLTTMTVRVVNRFVYTEALYSVFTLSQ